MMIVILHRKIDSLHSAVDLQTVQMDDELNQDNKTNKMAVNPKKVKTRSPQEGDGEDCCVGRGLGGRAEKG
jgi:hypothetical protein